MSYRPDRPGRRQSPAARRRERRRALSGVEPPPARREPPPARREPPSGPRSTPPAGDHRERRPFFVWRGWESVVTYLVLAVMLVGLVTGLHRLLAAGILALGLFALAGALAAGRERPPGEGALRDGLVGLLPRRAGRAVYLVLCVVLIALGIIGLIAG